MNRTEIHESLEQLENDRWPRPSADATRLIRHCHAARAKPASQLSTEELRLLIGQRISLAWTVPFALHDLQRTPMVEGDLYPGDLLAACLSLPDEYFAAHPEVRRQLAEIVEQVGEDDWNLAFPGRFTEWR
ncbi:contact-dependent growth inhibition system immunity protein [Glycomyces buryatensis]|uniref:Uncharacterized protein n=1 Tax=Glycomyces buryatensis TaxID=2570927 RepID=A0A4S8QB99_9ACTN|nr:contact-dependent growth inhibition system immunity protein [Glycomyces buryatensis]THV40801.1 hypothetical protein FAB82_14225 [Glycomyces buryatensis]